MRFHNDSGRPIPRTKIAYTLIQKINTTNARTPQYFNPTSVLRTKSTYQGKTEIVESTVGEEPWDATQVVSRPTTLILGTSNRNATDSRNAQGYNEQPQRNFHPTHLKQLLLPQKQRFRALFERERLCVIDWARLYTIHEPHTIIKIVRSLYKYFAV